jgi:hypothetical protein
MFPVMQPPRRAGPPTTPRVRTVSAARRPRGDLGDRARRWGGKTDKGEGKAGRGSPPLLFIVGRPPPAAAGRGEGRSGKVWRRLGGRVPLESPKEDYAELQIILQM